jgi:hypothetical protein
MKDIKLMMEQEIEFCRKLKMMAGKTSIKHKLTRLSPPIDDY